MIKIRQNGSTNNYETPILYKVCEGTESPPPTLALYAEKIKRGAIIFLVKDKTGGFGDIVSGMAELKER